MTFPQIGQFIIGLGLLSMAGAFVQFLRVRGFVSGSARARGVVTFVRQVGGPGDEVVSYFPHVEFRVGERTVRFENPSSCYCKAGQDVEVLYPPSAPRDARINGGWSLYGAAVVFALLGMFAVFVGGGFVTIGGAVERARASSSESDPDYSQFKTRRYQP